MVDLEAMHHHRHGADEDDPVSDLVAGWHVVLVVGAALVLVLVVVLMGAGALR